MKLVIEITLDDNPLGVAKAIARTLDGTELKDSDIERMVLRAVVDNVPSATSAVIMNPVSIGPSFLHGSGTGYNADEETRQER